MSDAPDVPQDAVPATVPAAEPAAEPSAARPESRRLGPLPVWLWITLIAIAVALLIILGIALFARGGTPSAVVSPTPSASESVTPSATPSATPTPTPSSTPTTDPSGQGTFDSDLPSFLSDTLNSQNTAVLAQSGTFTNPVHLFAANSDLNENMSPEDAVTAMEFMFTPEDPNPWDLALSDSVLAGYRAGPYGEYFPVGAIVARSHDGHVFSFIGHDSSITTMFMAGSEDLLH
jgi:hypothetical protein